MVKTGATFKDAAAEYMRWLEHDRARKPSTLRDYESILRAHLLPEWGTDRLEAITTDQVEAWSARLAGSGMGNRTRLKILTVLHVVMGRAKRVWKLPRNPVSDVEKPTQARSVGIEVFSTEEIGALVRAAGGEQDAAIYLTAAYTGLRRGELVALRWRNVDFPRRHIRVTASYTEGALSTPKSGRARSGSGPGATSPVRRRERQIRDHRVESQSSTIERVKRMCRPMRRQGRFPVLVAS